MRRTWVIGVVLTLGLAVLLYPAFVQPRPYKHKLPLCVSNVKMLGLSQVIYASDFDDRFSPREAWMDLTYPYVKDWSRYHCPQAKGKWGYAYDGALASESVPSGPSELPMVYDSLGEGKNAADLVTSLPRPGRHQGKNDVVYADGHAKAEATP